MMIKEIYPSKVFRTYFTECEDETAYNLDSNIFPISRQVKMSKQCDVCYKMIAEDSDEIELEFLKSQIFRLHSDYMEGIESAKHDIEKITKIYDVLKAMVESAKNNEVKVSCNIQYVEYMKNDTNGTRAHYFFTDTYETLKVKIGQHIQMRYNPLLCEFEKAKII